MIPYYQSQAKCKLPIDNDKNLMYTKTWEYDNMSLYFNLVMQGSDDPYECPPMAISHHSDPIWREAGVYDVLYLSEGKLPKDIIDTIRKGLISMISNPDRYMHLHPSASYDGSFEFLWRVYLSCMEYPDATISISE
jgi:hypothetical protein